MTRSRTISSIAVAIVATVVLVLAIRVEPGFAVAWGVLAGVLTLCAQLVIPEDPRADSPRIPAEPERRGTSISRMAWSSPTKTDSAIRKWPMFSSRICGRAAMGATVS